MALQVGRGNPTYQPFPQGGTQTFQPEQQPGLPPGAQTSAPSPGWGSLPNAGNSWQTTSAPAGGGGQDPRDPAYVRQQVTDALTKRAQAYGRPAPTEADIQQGIGYVLTPDRYSDGNVRSGWSDYWANRLGIPGNEGGASGDYGGSATLLPDDNSIGRGPGNGSFGNMGGGGMPAGYSATGANRLASFSAPGLAAPWTEQFNAPADFQAPTADEVMNSPAVQARLKMGEEGLQRSAAAKGTLLTGGTLKDLANYDQGVAAQEYGDEYNRRFQANNNTYGRRLGEYQMDEGTFFNNSNNAYNKLAGFTQLGMQGTGQLGGYGTGYSNSAQNNANATGGLLTGQANATANAQTAQANNTNTTLGGLAESAGAVDWSKVFKGRGASRGGVPV